MKGKFNLQKLQSKRNLSWIQLVGLYIFPLLSFYGYKYVGLNLSVIKGLYFIAVPLVFLYVRHLIFTNNKYNPYYWGMVGITISTVASILMAYLFWNQSIALGYRSTAPLLAIVYYFYLLRTRPSKKNIELLIWVFTGIYILLWLYGMSKVPQIVFGDSENELSDSRGLFRLSLPGKGFIVLAFFLCLSKFSVTKEKKFIALSIGLFIIIIMHVIRQVIILSFLIGLYFLLRKNKRLWIYLGIAAVFMFYFNNVQVSDDSVIGKLLALSQNQLEEQSQGDENVRILEYKFFFSDFSKNLITDIFGNGYPHDDSTYGKYNQNIAQARHKFFLSDVGYAQVFVVNGLLGLLLYFLIFTKVIKLKTSDSVVYAKLFIIYQFFANVTAAWYMHDIICICICIYILSAEKISTKINRRRNEIFYSNTRV